MSENCWDVVVIGGGAAGFFSAIRLKELNPKFSIVVLEKTQKTLSKVRISGGGRCNVTHHCLKNSDLLQQYPRGKKIIKQAVHKFNVQHTIDWFNSHGVSLKIESDGRMFPTTDSSETIAGLFEDLVDKFGIKIIRGCAVKTLVYSKGKNEYNNKYNWEIFTSAEKIMANSVVIATGGQMAWTHYQWISELPISIIKPYPSLFTFNIQDKQLQSLSGISVPSGAVKLIGFDSLFQGPVLITHWGLSGPAVLKASAWAAQWIYDRNYSFQILISWIIAEENQFRQQFNILVEQNAKKKIINLPLEIPNRLWQFILWRSEINSEKIIGELTKAQKNKIIEMLLKMPFTVTGKTTFKEEFVTAGGIGEDSIDPNTLAIKQHIGLYACGEILNVDGVTGGFNFQAAWSTANLVANSIAYSPFSENL